MLNRRAALLGGMSILPLLAGCALTPSQLVQYATAALNAAQDLVASGGVTLPASVKQAIADVTTAANAVITGLPAGAVSWPQALYDAVKALLPLAAPLLGTIPGLSLGLAALQALLPFIAQAAGLAAVAAAPAVRGIPSMTLAQALKLYGGK